MRIDSTADFYLLDNLEPITLRVAGSLDVVIPKALNEPAEWKEAEVSGGNVLEGDQLWVWPIVATPTRPPLGAKIIDSDGTIWTILNVTRKDHVNTYEAHARNLAVVYNLNNLATVLKASYSKSAGGEARPTWNTLLTGIPARFQPISQEAQILEDAEWPKTTYQVFFGIDIFDPDIPVTPASADYRLVDSAGKRYRIMEYKGAETIDSLAYALCVLIIEGSEGSAIDRIDSSSSGSSSSGVGP